MFEKVSRSLKYDSNIFFVHNIYNIYIRTPDPITLPRLRCACGVNIDHELFSVSLILLYKCT